MLGLIANIHIARKNRLASSEIQKLSSFIKQEEETILLLRTYTKSAENFRVGCWGLFLHLKNLLDQPRTQWELDNTQVNVDRFSRSFEDFFETWAEIKGDIPEYALDSLRTMRHEIKNEFGTISALLIKLENSINRSKLKKALLRDIDELISMLSHLLESIDLMFKMVNEIKQSKIEEFIETRHA